MQVSAVIDRISIERQEERRGQAVGDDGTQSGGFGEGSGIHEFISRPSAQAVVNSALLESAEISQTSQVRSHSGALQRYGTPQFLARTMASVLCPSRD